MEIIFTGSRVYGRPKKDSDLDIVILCNDEEARLLNLVCDKEKQRTANYPEGSFNLYFGNLNIIVTTDEGTFNSWKEGTQLLKDMSDYNEIVTKKIAIKVLERFGVGQTKNEVSFNTKKYVPYSPPRRPLGAQGVWHMEADYAAEMNRILAQPPRPHEVERLQGIDAIRDIEGNFENQ